MRVAHGLALLLHAVQVARRHARSAPIATSTIAATHGPMAAPARAKRSSCAPEIRPALATTASGDSTKHHLQWPSEKKTPTVVARRPDATSRRVTLSIAAMWSASTPWRQPNATPTVPPP